MKFSRIAAVGAGILTALLAMACANADHKISAEAEGHCKLKNTAKGRELYNGDCTIKQTVKNNGNETIWKITMGTTEPFLFACSPNGQCMHGPEDTQFKDHGRSGTFRWGDFKLDVEQD